MFGFCPSSIVREEVSMKWMDRPNVTEMHGAMQDAGQGLFPPQRFLRLHQPPGDDFN